MNTTKKIEHAAVFSKSQGGVMLKVWFTPDAGKRLDVLHLEEAVEIPFKDDLVAGKLMWVSSYYYDGKNYWDDLHINGVFLDQQVISCLQIIDGKISLNIPDVKKAKEPKPSITDGKAAADFYDFEEYTQFHSPVPDQKTTITFTRKKLFWYMFWAWIVGILIGFANGTVFGAVVVCK